MSLTRIPSSLVANTFTANTVLFANALGYLSNTSNFKYFSGNNTISVGAVVAGGIDVISYTQAAFSAANAAGSSAYVQSAYNQANTATGIAQAAFNSANNVAPQVQPAFNKANSANVLAQAAYDSSNAVNQYATSAYGVANTNATNITLVNQYAVSGYNQANTATGIAQAAFNSANNVAPQVQPAFDKANTTSANTIIIQGVDLTQNTNITTANNAAWAAYAAGNTNATNITLVNQFAQSAYNAANAAGSSSYVQAAFDKANTALANTTGTFAGSLTTTGNVRVISTQAATSITTGALTVSGGVGVSGNLYAGNIYTNGALINNSAALTVYKYVATAGQTTFSGSDSNALTLSYVASAIFVTLNGVVLSNTLEYTATNGTSVILGTAAELDDELNIYSFGAFQLADAYTTIQADSKFLTQANAITSYVSTANGTAINQFAAGAYNTANGANGLAAGAYNTANGANGLAASAYNTANGANGLATGAYAQANVTIGVDATQNTQISGLQGVDLATNSAITIIQGTDLTQNNSIAAAFTRANSVYLPSVTRLDVTNSGSSGYLFDQYTGNNPTLYIRAGETIAFSLGVTGHPFLIRVSNGGSNYSTGLTHVTTTGTVTTGASAQGQVTGTLYWKVPAELAGNTYVYQCQVHSGMVGNIVIERPNKVASITGTSNQIIVTGTTTPTLSTPQDIGTASSVQHGSLGIGTAASGVAGEIRAINNITGYYSSDKKYKENITTIPNALNKVDAIGGKMFDWTDSYIQEHGGEDGYFVQKRDFGVIAQDVQAVFPEAVRTREDGFLAVDYSKLSALAFAAIVELKKEIEQLKNNK